MWTARISSNRYFAVAIVRDTFPIPAWGQLQIHSLLTWKSIILFPTGAIARSAAYFGQGTGDIVYDEVQCNGTEARLQDCPRVGIGSIDCFHFEDAGVECQGKHLACVWAMLIYSPGFNN